MFVYKNRFLNLAKRVEGTPEDILNMLVEEFIYSHILLLKSFF